MIVLEIKATTITIAIPVKASSEMLIVSVLIEDEGKEEMLMPEI
jgi:hypothetical protein